jgi:hypothetical protein
MISKASCAGLATRVNFNFDRIQTKPFAPVLSQWACTQNLRNGSQMEEIGHANVTSDHSERYSWRLVVFPTEKGWDPATMQDVMTKRTPILCGTS